MIYQDAKCIDGVGVCPLWVKCKRVESGNPSFNIYLYAVEEMGFDGDASINWDIYNFECEYFLLRGKE